MTAGGAPPLLVRSEGAARWLTLNRPRKRNALSGALVRALHEAVEAAEADPAVRVVVVQGAGEDFCAGADLRELERSAGATVAAQLADADALGELFLRIRKLAKPVIAAVRGRALAGGCGLATACDLVLASASARFGYPEVGIGFVPAMVMAILRRNVGEKRAFDLVTSGRTIGAAEAERIGLVNHVYPDADFDERVRGFAGELSARSASAMTLSKRLLYVQDGMGFEAGIRSGAEVNVLARATPDARAGIAGFGRGREG